MPVACEGQAWFGFARREPVWLRLLFFGRIAANSVGLTGLVAIIKNRVLGLRNRKQGIANYAKG